MPTIDQIRAAIAATIVSAVPAAAVHDYERFAADQAKFREFYLSGAAPDQRILGYHVRRASTREVAESTGRWSIWHRWRIRGAMAVDDADASEKLFDAQIETIRTAFRADESLGGLIFGMVEASTGEVGIQVLDEGPVMFAGVLCHFAEMRLTTQHLL